MFTDMVGYTALAQSNEPLAMELLDEQRKALRPFFAKDNGREVKTIGDAFLVEFASSIMAVKCAFEIQSSLQAANSSRPEGKKLLLRIGIHLGDVIHSETDITGDAVNVASRIQALAPIGGVCVTEQVYESVVNKVECAFESLGTPELKNVSRPIEVYQISGLGQTLSRPRFQKSGLPKERVAVLPLVNMTNDPKEEYFADGMTEEMISTLSNLSGLTVISRTSAMQYKGAKKSLVEIGRELGAGTLMEGSVRKAGNRVRITVQLIDASEDKHLWAQSYDRELQDIFAVQSDVATSVADALKVRLLDGEAAQIRKQPTASPAAFDLYLKGIHAARQSTTEGWTKSIGYFEEAIRIDPQFSLAYSALANSCISSAGDSLAPHEAFPRAKELIAKALQLDSGSSDAHTARGNLELQYERNWEVSESEFKKAISLNPSDAIAHFWYAHLLMVLRRFHEAIEHFRMTIELDPLWEAPRIGIETVYTLSREFRKAIALTKEKWEREPPNPGDHASLGLLYLWAGRIDDARKEAELSAGSVDEHRRWSRAVLWAGLGKPEEARQLVKELEDSVQTRFVTLSDIAILYAALGKKERALDWLERDFQTGDSILWLTYQSINFDPIREDPRFQSMLRKLNLPTDGEGRVMRSARGIE